MKLLPYISPALFVIACCLPAAEFTKSTPGPDIMFGLRALVVGWAGLFAGVVCWYANVFWIAGVVLSYFRKPTFATVMGIVAVCLAYTAFAVVGQVFPADEGNVNKTTVVRLLPGCYVWMASMVTMPLVSLVQRFTR